MKIALFGATGKLGKAIGSAFLEDPSISLVPLTHKNSPFLGKDYGALLKRSPLALDVEENAPPSDLFIDVSLPTALVLHVNIALLQKKPLIVGTTNLEESDFSLLKQASQTIPIFYSANFSLGLWALQEAAKTLKRSLIGARIDIIEKHHKGKRDAPSGTALCLQDALEAKIPIHSIREGSILGEHTVVFDLGEESITCTHTVKSRKVFTDGVKKAVLFLIEQKKGLYGMQDLLQM